MAAPRTTPRPFRRRTLWLGFAAVLVPLGVLLALQYRWLVELEHASEASRQAALSNYLEAVAGEIGLFYTSSAERVLNVPAHVFTQGRLDKAAGHFKKKAPEGARRLFVVSFVGEKSGKPLFFNPSCSSFEPADWSPELRAVVVAASSWQTLAHKGGVVEPVALAVDERDPAHRIVLNPITDDASRVVGVAGMVLDERYLRETLLPAVIDRALPSFFHDPEASPVVQVADGRGRRVFSTMPAAWGRVEAERPLSFAFTDWKVGLASRHPHAGEWARSNFRLNVGLSALLAAVLTGGVVLALRTASREIKLSQMKSDFVSNVSHELRTPLASIRVFGELLRLGRLTEAGKVPEYGEYIETESHRLTQLIDNLLDFAHIESGRKSYRLEPVDLGKIVAETLETFEVRLKQSGFRLAYRGPRRPLPPLDLDAPAIAHSLANLIDNAVKYSGDGREVEVTLDRRGDEAVLAVRDWGIGVPRDEHEKIFDRFHRVSTGLVHDVKGSGLGLAIVRHVIDAHGGRVEVESRPGQGSTFTLVLPLAALAVEAAEPEAAEGGLGLPPRRPS
ncbi:MAG TPA: HAMP domain-containing sensor histidine kinase, partial [Thermoanaerobaculia bacterium]